ncbi:MAG TPA: TIGR03620 family F420-dependent LLM class oxidoreductase [Steroidobacteraceae bacterium]|nr:TIGR03620 family F420-dependent LLM class oxidoreductase [Steroidobacteraceae bacterium]
MNLAKLGVWAAVDRLPAIEAAAFARRIEAWGFSALWIPEGLGREVFSSAAWLLAGTTRLVVASGIANIYARDAFCTAAAQQGLNEQSGGRFLLGLGVSHVPLVQVRQHQYGKPLATMRAYLETMAMAHYQSIPPAAPPRTLLAALGPKMLELSAQRADGAHPYNVTPEHTERARSILGAGKLLCVEQAALLERDPARARAIGREFLGIYLNLPNYVENWKRLGFGAADFAGGGSERLIDATVAWGDEGTIRARLEAHLQAGADHVCVQALSAVPGVADERLLALLAPGA